MFKVVACWAVPKISITSGVSMTQREGGAVQSASAIAIILAFALCLPWQTSGAENVLILNGDFIQKYKNRATIEASYLIDKAHHKPNSPSKDAGIPIAGRAPEEIGLATVAEVMNAAEQPAALDAIHAAEGSGQAVKVVGIWRIWPEHGGESAHARENPRSFPHDEPRPPVRDSPNHGDCRL
jgi:hypothetical protein